jgi:hypothetical protein
MQVFCLRYSILILILIPFSVFGQVSITVTKPRLEVSDNKLLIQYDILNTKSSDLFIVWIEVADASGNKINALSLTGDIGSYIKGGRNKKITWNYINDSIFIDEDLFVEVKAEKVIQNEERITQEISETRENKKESEISEETKAVKSEKTSSMEISKGKMILTSAVLPGWGQTRASMGKPFWLIGAAGYGCIAGSVILNRSASSAYDDYKSSMDPDESNTLFDKAANRNSFSKVLGYSAIGIWAADLIWVVVTPARHQQAALKQSFRKVRVSPGYNACLNAGTITLTYNF